MVRSALLLLTAVALAGCGGGKASTPESAGSVKELTNILELRSDFEADAGKTRLLVLLSPT